MITSAAAGTVDGREGGRAALPGAPGLSCPPGTVVGQGTSGHSGSTVCTLRIPRGLQRFVPETSKSCDLSVPHQRNCTVSTDFFLNVTISYILPVNALCRASTRLHFPLFGKKSAYLFPTFWFGIKFQLFPSLLPPPASGCPDCGDRKHCGDWQPKLSTPRCDKSRLNFLCIG